MKKKHRKRCFGIALYAKLFALKNSFLNIMRHFLMKEPCHPLMTASKVVPRGERLVFPLSIYVNHAFVDGSHLAFFFEKIEKYLKEISHE